MTQVSIARHIHAIPRCAYCQTKLSQRLCALAGRGTAFYCGAPISPRSLEMLDAATRLRYGGALN